jgi:polysaccharide export outer membrane protein
MWIAFRRAALVCLLLAPATAVCLSPLAAQEQEKTKPAAKAELAPTASVPNNDFWPLQMTELASVDRAKQEYRIGPEDLLEISVLEAPELSRTARVSESGEISLPLLGAVTVAGRTPRQEEAVLEELLRRSYLKDPHVSIFVKEITSHSVSVLGAVKRPGVLQIRGPKRLVEILSMAEGLADDAGDSVLVIHQGIYDGGAQGLSSTSSAGEEPQASTPSSGIELKQSGETGAGQITATGRAEEINVRTLLDANDLRSNVFVFPGDEVRVARAGIVYVVGEVRRPGGFPLKSNGNISVLQALALAEGLTRTSAKKQARIIRTDSVTGERQEIPINLSKVLSGRAADPTLQPRDILFVPNSATRSALYRGAESALSVGTGLAIYRW